MTDLKKKIILVSVLALVLVALILVYFLVIIPLTEEKPPEKEPIYVAPGEGLYGNLMITVYPEIDKSKVEYIEINNEHGSITFHKYYDSTMEKEDMRIKGLEGIDFDQSMYALLVAYIRLPVSYQSNLEANAPMRNLTDAQMEQYGVTEDKCTASYTIGFKENGVSKSHTVYIGYPTFTDETTYYVALKGRNSVYRFHQEGVETSLYASLESFLTPVIFGRFKNITEAMVNINRFKIGVTDPDKINDDDYIRSIIEIVKTGQNLDGTSNMYDLLYKSLGTGKIVRTGASVDRLSTAFTALYTYFAGDTVVAVNPTDEELKKYGLSAENKVYFVNAQLSDDENDTCSFIISEETDGYFYTQSAFYGEEYPIIVRVPKATLSFLNDDGKEIFKWAGTDVSSLFYEYLLRDEEAKEPGMSNVTVRIQKRDDKTGNIIYNTKESFDIVESGSGGIIATTTTGKKYEGYLNSDGEEENEFTDYYRLLIYFPNPIEFNNLTEAEIEALKNDDSAIVFELVARDNANRLFRYTYYQIGNSLDIMIETCEGKIENGQETWESPKISFNTALSQMDILRVNLQKLLNGEDVRPEDYIY